MHRKKCNSLQPLKFSMQTKTLRVKVIKYAVKKMGRKIKSYILEKCDNRRTSEESAMKTRILLGKSEGLMCTFTLFRPIDVNCFCYSLASLSLKWSPPGPDFCSFVCFLSRSIREA